MSRENNGKYKLYLQYESTSTGGDQGRHRKPYSSRAPKYIDTKFQRLLRSRGEGFFPCGEEILVTEEQHKAPQLYLVIVRHTDGDSFGTTHGCHHVQGVFVVGDEAMAMAKKIMSGEFAKENPNVYYPWGGYFTRLEDVEVHCFKIRDVETEDDDSVHIHYHD